MTAFLQTECPLCGDGCNKTSANFTQLYRQYKSKPAEIFWWECGSCNGWFASPQPSKEQIESNWKCVTYQQKSMHGFVSNAKQTTYNKLLTGINSLKKDSNKGSLLDVGCNFGDFLSLSKKQGWIPCGFDASESAVSDCITQGFDVRLAWSIMDTDFDPDYFSAIVVNDVFCYTKHPYTELKGYFNLLASGGVLAMRVTNKHLALRTMRLLVSGEKRNKLISTTLIDQYHSIGLRSFKKILIDIGFNNITISTNAYTAPWKNSPWKTRLFYTASHIAYYLSFGKVNIYPGILIFAVKK